MDESLAEAAHGALEDVRRLALASKRLAKIRWLRIRASVQRGTRLAVLALWAAVVGLTLTVVAAFYVMRGIVAAMVELTGAAWSGQLAGGALVLLAVVALWVVSAVRGERARFRRTRASLNGTADGHRSGDDA